jgi:hypothetical protein
MADAFRRGTELLFDSEMFASCPSLFLDKEIRIDQKFTYTVHVKWASTISGLVPNPADLNLTGS